MLELRIAVACVAVLALVGACATGPKLEPPRVSIASLKLENAELWSQRFKVRLHLHNPNDRDLPVQGLEYTIEIAGQEFANGSCADSFVIPAHGDAEFDTNVTTNLAAAVLKLVTHVPTTLVPYRLVGKLTLGEGLGRLAFEEHASFTP
ncbi:MAG TPA: LEA type 2 family protein [Steroidobacteraceae bacterium]|nr:LEA type 2 family protein [Steroidobacteraceae bacterium]